MRGQGRCSGEPSRYVGPRTCNSFWRLNHTHVLCYAHSRYYILHLGRGPGARATAAAASLRGSEACPVCLSRRVSMRCSNQGECYKNVGFVC